MPIPWLTQALRFPAPDTASAEGVVAVGGDASPERLLLAYSQGIFPWPHGNLPLLWFSPDPRFVLLPDAMHVPRSLRKRIRHRPYEVRFDTAFEAVIRACARTPRPGQDGTWITEDLVEGYCRLHALGFAHSIEAWHEGALVGGLYGVSIGTAFFGESMFSHADDASKIATVALAGNLKHWGFALIDCQVHTDHLERFGAQEWSRARYLSTLTGLVSEPTRRGQWQIELDPEACLSVLQPALLPNDVTSVPSGK